ncbi:MAG: response regulator transcription factor [Leptospiraceae bacterium]|nr:response regulator transcription factor [Leptospiraceae bacterium]
MYKIILADDHSATRKGVKACLEQDKLFRVVFEASNGYELENILDKRLYDIILLDINMKDMDGIEFLKRCRKKIINKRIVIYSMLTGSGILQEAISLGIHGFISKEEEITELNNTLKRIMNGESYFSSTLYSVTNPNEDYTLSKKQKVILKFLLDGKSYQEIAEIQQCSYRTVEFHVKKLKDIFHTNSLLELISKAREVYFF